MLKIMTTTATIAFGAAWATASLAGITTDQVARDMTDLGYSHIVIKRSATRLDVEATRDGEKLHVVYDRDSGDILQREMLSDGPDQPGATPRAPHTETADGSTGEGTDGASPNDGSHDAGASDGNGGNHDAGASDSNDGSHDTGAAGGNDSSHDTGASGGNDSSNDSGASGGNDGNHDAGASGGNDSNNDNGASDGNDGGSHDGGASDSNDSSHDGGASDGNGGGNQGGNDGSNDD